MHDWQKQYVMEIAKSLGEIQKKSTKLTEALEKNATSPKAKLGEFTDYVLSASIGEICGAIIRIVSKEQDSRITFMHMACLAQVALNIEKYGKIDPLSEDE